jgi:cytochrome c oxidase cbb3-type subunit 2
MFHWFEQRPFFFAVLVFIFLAFAGIIEVIPDFAKQSRPTVGTKPYSVLELAGRHVYIKDSCNACHSQLIRPANSKTEYGFVPTVGLLCFAKSGITSIIPANATNKNTSTAKKNGLCSNQ